ncbi:hypothetical protein LP109_05555 [Moraxella bovis]|uniref:hypothetical protein n=1 Tax=Moraxella bovis TaxID=476 RepID=UPI0009948528|nr:hypothetical protein [Moraxella bovis]OOR90796.1 hypothetical protein B0182_04575 [Moraxella bovis]UZA17748.1 hypothetical protein LP109_05555 [Moraxella bovis]
MSKVKFKVGDLVYCPSISSEILNIKVLPIDVMVFDITHSISRNDCGFVSYLNNAAIVRLDNGCCTKTHFQKIVHATTENHRLLSKLYPNVAFEPPPKRKEPREIIEAMLKAGYDGVPCKTDCKQYRFVCVNVSDDPYFPFVYDSLDKDDAFSSAIPYCYQTGKTIIDFVDGEVVLED